MSKLIVKSPYIRNSKTEKVSGYMKYIATRDNVEIIKAEEYLRYIATRPKVEHGLFGDEKFADLESAMLELDSYEGRIWTHVFSLTGEDGARLGYDNMKSWHNLIKAHRNDIAKAMNIPCENFRWYAAYHHEVDHPHVHMMAWSSDPSEGYLSREGITKIKSKLTNDIFKHAMLFLFEQKTVKRTELVEQSQRKMRELVAEIKEGIPNFEGLEMQILKLSQRLSATTGKKTYGYLKADTKKLVDEILDAFTDFEIIADVYAEWAKLQEQIEGYYGEKEFAKKPLSQEKVFHSLKNVIISEASKVGEITFEDEDMAEIGFDDRHVGGKYCELKEVILSDQYYLNYRDECVDNMEKIAEYGNIHAQYFMGSLYEKSDIVIPGSKKSKKFYLQAAEQGHSLAQYKHGKLLLSNDTMVRDVGEGEYWLKSSADDGNDFAKYALAKEYLTEANLPKDEVTAQELLTQSADNGHEYSQYMLGKLLYKNGNVIEAKNYLSKAVEQGNSHAQVYLERVENGVAPYAFIATMNILRAMGELFGERAKPKDGHKQDMVDKKLYAKIQEKKRAHGHKSSGHTMEMRGY